jgi:four helix bundle protein
MKYARFEDLPVWQDSISLCVKGFALTEDPAFRHKGDIGNQLERALLSISNNVAEGFERGTTQELITFIYYARGSAGEVRSILCVLERMPQFAHLHKDIAHLKSLAEGVARQLRAWAESLQDSDIAGQRHLNEKTRRIYEQRVRAEKFEEFIKQELERCRAQQKEQVDAPPPHQSEISNPQSHI